MTRPLGEPSKFFPLLEVVLKVVKGVVSQATPLVSGPSDPSALTMSRPIKQLWCSMCPPDHCQDDRGRTLPPTRPAPTAVSLGAVGVHRDLSTSSRREALDKALREADGHGFYG